MESPASPSWSVNLLPSSRMGIGLSLALIALAGHVAAQPRGRRAPSEPEPPTFGALVQWMLEAPRTFEVEVRGTETVGSRTQSFAMHGRLRWLTTERRGRLALEQTDFQGFVGTPAPAAFARNYLLAFIDPIFDQDDLAVGVAHAERTASEVRSAIAAAPGVPGGSPEMFERMLTEQGMTRIADDFFSPFIGYARRPPDGESRIVGEQPTTMTPFGPIAVPTRLRFQSLDHADCPDGTRGACIAVRFVAEPDAMGLGRELSRIAPPLPEGVHFTRMELREETSMLVRRSPARIEQLQSHRTMHVHARHEGHRDEREIVGSDITYTCRYADASH